MYSQTAARVHYPALDILRGIAILIVVFYHNFSSVSFFRFGWMGVDLFFVLSGFLITNLLLESRQNKNYIRNFYVRRFLRIFPLYYLILIVFFTFSPLLFSAKGPATTYSYYNDNKLWYWSYFQNWLMVHKGPPPVPFLAHFWSLAIEEQFYVFWPIILFFVKKLDTLKRVIYALIITAVISRVCTWYVNPNEVETFYCSTLTRMDSLLMGCLLAVHLKQGREVNLVLIKWVILSFLLLIATSLLLFGNVRQDNLLFPTIGYTISAAFFSSILYHIIKNESSLVKWIKHLKPLHFIGKISYGVYVFHIPVYLTLNFLLTDYLELYSDSLLSRAFIISCLSFLITLVISTFSFYLLEKPILNLKKHFP